MAETTPGPLIMVLSFVGFLAAFRDAGGLDPMVAGLLGGLLTAWVTFVPSFLWIFLGAPYMERLRGNRNLSGALAAITAAVVGVILNLALWLGLHVLFREVGVLDLGIVRPAWPVWSTLDPWALGLMAGRGPRPVPASISASRRPSGSARCSAWRYGWPASADLTGADRRQPIYAARRPVPDGTGQYFHATRGSGRRLPSCSLSAARKRAAEEGAHP